MLRNPEFHIARIRRGMNRIGVPLATLLSNDKKSEAVRKAIGAEPAAPLAKRRWADCMDSLCAHHDAVRLETEIFFDSPKEFLASVVGSGRVSAFMRRNPATPTL